MRRFLSLILLSTALLAAAGLAVLLAPPAEPAALPRLPRALDNPEVPRPHRSAFELVAPWQTQRTAAGPTPAAPQAPPLPDRTSLIYLGTLTNDTAVQTYLFKILARGQVVPLVLNVENQGWTLFEVNSQEFLLRGPGGLYAVPR